MQTGFCGSRAVKRSDCVSSRQVRPARPNATHLWPAIGHDGHKREENCGAIHQPQEWVVVQECSQSVHCRLLLLNLLQIRRGGGGGRWWEGEGS